eukprot:TRINITY_DN17587_c0_g1_i2.p1 TRINITY_DN17587_c0_g1~~TRINITY_DN17587_c0_g1_i2.p1  ORF type:complete len:511 (-),score=60.70 TRINITY_DN17587_c0_g1_i2:814-2346(-)
MTDSLSLSLTSFIQKDPFEWSATLLVLIVTDTILGLSRLTSPYLLRAALWASWVQSLWSTGFGYSLAPVIGRPARAARPEYIGVPWRSQTRFFTLAAMAAAGIVAGSRVFIRYDGFDLWHERLALSHVAQNEWVVCTPDFDLFVEQLDGGNVDLDRVRVQVQPGILPLGIPPNQCYRHRALTVAEEAQLLTEATTIANAEKNLRGLAGAGAGGGLPAAAVVVPLAAPMVAVPGAAVPAAAGGAVAGAVAAPVAAPLVAGPRFAGAAGTWVIDEPTAQWDIGDELVLPAGAVRLGPDVALVSIANEAVKVRLLAPNTNISEYVLARRHFLADDPRILPSANEEQDFISAIKEMSGPRSIGPASPLEGPDTKTCWLDNLLKSGIGSMVARHHRWRSESGVKNGRLVHEHELLSRALQVFATIDGINLKQCEGAEVLLRRIQLLEEAVVDSPEDPSMENAEHFMGFSERRGGALISPALKKHAGETIGKEAAILKERRKAREARAGKGKGEGK